MSAKRIGFATVFLSLLPAAAAVGEIHVNDFDVALYGRWWHVDSFFVQDDLLSGDDTFLEPEGLAFADGILYVSGDRGHYQTDSRLARYDYFGAGVLTFNSYLQMTIASDPNGWGPEGLVFNNSGSGYGSGANQLVSVEKDGSGRAAIIDLVTGEVGGVVSMTAAEDVAYLVSQTGFSTLEDAGGPVAVAFYDETFVPLGDTMTVAPATNGSVAVDAAFASFLTRKPISSECLLTVTSANPGNAINVYDLSGNAIGDQQGLPVEPKARIPMGGGFFLIKPAFGTVEAITIYESQRVIYIGDEENCMVHVLQPGNLVADFDDDGDVDLDDYGLFQDCLAGPGVETPPADCTEDEFELADLDGDSDVDASDFAEFQTMFAQ